MFFSLDDDSQPHTPIKPTSFNWQHPNPGMSTTLEHGSNDSGDSTMPPDFPLPGPPAALASPFHPGTTLASSSRSKVDRFQDVRNLFAKRQLQRQNSTDVQTCTRRCFCEKELEDEDDIYCSSACARTDAMSSLCFAETQRMAAVHTTQSSISSLSSVASSSLTGRSARASSTASTSHTRTSSDINLSPSQASHYRRTTSEELKRQRAGHSRTASHSSRRRQRQEGVSSSVGTSIGSMASVMSTGFNRVPELVGGHPYAYTPSHSRNPSNASSATSSHPSAMMASLLSRHPSATSNHSRNGSAVSVPLSRGGIALAEIMTTGPLSLAGAHENGGLTNVKEEMEDDIERLADAEEDGEYANQGRLAYYPTKDIHDSGRLPDAQINMDEQDTLPIEHLDRALEQTTNEPFEMGRDMQDVLDEIIMMEKGFHVNSSESEHETDGEGDSATGHRLGGQGSVIGSVAQSRPHTPPFGIEASRRRSIDLPAAPRRSAHHSNDFTCLPTPSQPLGPAAGIKLRGARYSGHIPSRSEPSLDLLRPKLVPSESLMAQLPSAFEDAIEEENEPDAGFEHGTLGLSLREGRRSFTRRSRSEIRRSLTFIPPKGYRASLLASIQESTTPKAPSLRTPVATTTVTTLTKRRSSAACLSVLVPTAADARMSAHPYRRSVLRGLDDSVTRFQFPRMAAGHDGAVGTASNAESGSRMIGLEDAAVLLEPLVLRSEDSSSAEPMDINTPTGPAGHMGAAHVSRTQTETRLEPSLFPASPPPNVRSLDPPANATDVAVVPASVPHSGLRLGVLLGSGVDDRNDDVWFRSGIRGGGVDDDGDDAMDVEESRL